MYIVAVEVSRTTKRCFDQQRYQSQATMFPHRTRNRFRNRRPKVILKLLRCDQFLQPNGEERQPIASS